MHHLGHRDRPDASRSPYHDRRLRETGLDPEPATSWGQNIHPRYYVKFVAIRGRFLYLEGCTGITQHNRFDVVVFESELETKIYGN